MPLILSGNVASAIGGGYEVANSCRFNDGDSPYMRKTFSGSATSSRKMTISVWCKLGALGANRRIFTADTDDSTNNRDSLFFTSTDQLHLFINNADGGTLKTTRVFRDPSAWYHIVIAIDTTQSTNTDRIKYYVNGVQETSFDSGGDGIVYPSQNYDVLGYGQNRENTIGADSTNGGDNDQFDGYLSEFVFIDGLALAPTSFGEFDEDSPTIWKPIDVSGLTFGDNGFYLDFEDSGDLGDDESGNTNDFTETNLAATDQSTDTPTNNFAVLNPLFKQDGTFSEGNLEYVVASTDFDSGLSTFGASNGKWYFETKTTAQSSGTTRNAFGICDARDGNLFAEGEFGQDPSGRLGDSTGYAGNGSGNVLKNGSDQGSGFNTTYETNDILSCAVDLDNGAVYYRKNDGSWLNSGDPESGASKTGAVTITTGETYLFGNTSYGGASFQINFGSPPYAISSGNADGNGYGNFEYAVPSGYYALNTKNLAEFG